MRPSLAAAATAMLVFACGVPAAHAAQEKVAVLSLGEDAAAAGALQTLVEARIARLPGVKLIPVGDIGRATGARNDPALSTFDQTKAHDLLAAARRAAAEDRLSDAFGILAQLEALQEGAIGVPIEDRVALRLWRTSVLVSLGDRERASAEARSAIAIVPHLTVDTGIFRPSVASLVEEIRGSGLPEATVTMKGLPRGAEVMVDDRPGGERFGVIAGRHWLRISAKGFRTAERSIEIDADSSLPADVSVAFDAPTRALLEGAAHGSPSKDDRQALDLLAEVLSAETLVVVGAARPFVWRQGENEPLRGPEIPATAAGRAALGDWAAARIVERALGESKEGVVGRAAIGFKIRAAEALRGVEAEGGLAYAVQRSVLRGDGGSVASARFRGTGPRVGFELEKNSIAVDGSLRWTTFAMFPAPGSYNGTRDRVSGGQTMQARLGAGYRLWVGNRESDHVMALTAIGGLVWERHEARDFAPPPAGALGLLPSHTRLAIEARTTARIPLRIAGTPAGIEFDAGIAPFVRWKEWPSGGIGRSPGVSPEIFWGAGASGRPVEKWLVRLRYAEGMRSVKYEGTGTAPTVPAFTRARLRERSHEITLSASHTF